MDYKETCARLKMIHDVREIAGKHSVDDVIVMLKECNLDPNEAAQRLLYIDTFHEVKKKNDRRKSTSSDEFEEYGRGRGNQWRGPRNGGRGNFYPSKVNNDAAGGRNMNSGKEYVVTNHVERVSRQTLPVDSGKQNGHMATSAAKINGTLAISNGSHSPKLAPKVPSYSEAVSYQNTKYTCSVGSIKCEIVKRESTSRLNGSTPGSKKFRADQAGAGTSPVIAEAASDVVVENQIPQSSLSTQNSSHVVSPTQENQSAKETVSEHTTSPIIDTHPTSEEASELKLSSPKLDVMLEKLTVSSRQPVIFPDHLQVPEKFKNQFVFGSLDVASDDSGPISVIESTQQNGDVVTEPSLRDDSGPISVIESTHQNGDVVTEPSLRDDSGPISVIESTHQNGDVVTEPSLSDQNVPTAQEVENEDHPLPNLSDHDEQTEQEMVPPIGGFQNFVFPTTRDYSYGFIPHPMSPHFVQLDVPELQSASSQVACTLVPTSAAQPAMAGQTSMAMSPPQFPYYRQPYPAYISYNPYFHPMYFAPNAQLLNHGVFPQQPPPVNVHMQPGVKLPAPPSMYKQESNEDPNASQVNDTNVQPAAQQGEGPQVRAPAAGVEVVPTLPPHYFYNFPQAQHIAFSPLQAGLYHSSQTMTSQPTIQPPLTYQIQPTSGTIEPVIQPPSSYQQTQPALLNRETN
ncbi:hypothetical protein CTI12_AA507390 [Artemisia annua]|uniref:GBF-interacting protein 1 N-terminal domain-containing protein n=1 Tax=Artemisia annua TaxID=35608 RepID=A0A2U1LC45_ARTAN|nr:hypothetical protein CTI12_AA507390 [Artemisia annua]